MEIWLQTNVEAHDFIPESYWRKNYESVKGMLPDAQIFIYEDGNIIQGFVGLMKDYIAGILSSGTVSLRVLENPCLRIEREATRSYLCTSTRKNPCGQFLFKRVFHGF